MPARQRALDRGTARGRHALRSLGPEIRQARVQLGLSAAAVAKEVGVSTAEVTRVERAQAEWASVLLLARICAVVGLDLSVRAYPGGRPLRDARHARVLEKFHATLHPALGWSLEVPLPNRGDQRAWDALVKGDGWRYGVECELNPIDGQALLRRLHLKEAEGGVDGVILVMPDTRQTRIFRREFAEALHAEFPVRQSVASKRLAAGLSPGGSAVIVP